jgi:membrane fusion protein (multidrug efflux system)
MEKTMYLKLYVYFLLLLMLGACTKEESTSENTTESRGRPVEAMVVAAEEVKERVALTGVLKPINTCDIISEVSGKVWNINKTLGDFVSENTVLAKIDDQIPGSNYEQAQAQVLSMETNLKIARLNLKSDSVLYASGDISRLSYDNSILAVKTAEANWLSAVAQLRNTRKMYEDTQIRTPIAGYVSRKYIERGTMVTPNMILYRVVDLSVMKIEASIPQSMINYVRIGTTADVKISALNNAVYKGIISYLSPEADEQSGAFKAEVHVKNKQDLLIRAGMTADIILLISEKQNKISVPEHALIIKNGDYFIYKIVQDTARLAPIQLEKTFGSKAIVADGLADGDTIVVVGMNNLGVKTAVWIEMLYE